MAILFGGEDRKLMNPKKNPYGEKLRQTALLELAGAFDIAVDEARALAFIAGRNELVTVDISNPGKPEVIGRLGGIGIGRQIELHRGIVYITARPGGLYICDVRNPRAPELMCHYDTVELATGVCAAGDLCFIACRHMGIEILDISNPAAPVHLSHVLAGEAQSVFADGNYMYVGAWVEREIMIFDISNPRSPLKVSVCELDGYGDGVFVRDNVCYAAAGHHARKFHNRRKYRCYDFVTEEMFSDGYGCGHGLEIFDISDIRHPRLLSRTKTPPVFYSSFDLWAVEVMGCYAFVADSVSGLFVFDVGDPTAPVFKGYHRMNPLQNLAFLAQPPIQQLCGPSSGMSVSGGYFYAVSPLSGLHVFDVGSVTGEAGAAGETGEAGNVGVRLAGVKETPEDTQRSASSADSPPVVFRVNSQVHGLVFYQNYAVVAAGKEGIYILDTQKDMQVAGNIGTEGFAMDIKLSGGYLYLAEGGAGLSVWRFEGRSLREVGHLRLDDPGQPVRQVVVYAEYRIAALHVGTDKVVFADIRDPYRPTQIGAFAGHGMMYYKNIVEGAFQGRYAVIAPLHEKTVFYDLKAGMPDRLAPGPDRDLCPLEDGIAVYGQSLLSVTVGGLHITNALNEGYHRGNRIDAGDTYLKGWPRITGSSLFLINRHSGIITCLDIADIKNPRVTGSFDTYGHPEDIVPYKGRIYVPCGHRGLLEL